MSVCMWGGKGAPQENFWRLVSSFHLVGPRDQTQVLRHGSRNLNPLNQLASPRHVFHKQFKAACLRCEWALTHACINNKFMRAGAR